jgi:hypothetical protein
MHRETTGIRNAPPLHKFIDKLDILIIFNPLLCFCFKSARNLDLGETGTYIKDEDSVSSAGIWMRKQQIAIISLAVWLTLISVFMLLAQSFNFEIFFVLSLIGFLIIVELIAQKYIQPGYMRYIRWILAASIVLFCVIVVQKVLEIFAR